MVDPPFLPPLRRPARSLRLALFCAASAGVPLSSARASTPADFAPDRVLVKYAVPTPPTARAATARTAGAIAGETLPSHTSLLRLARGVSVASALHRLRGQRDVVWAAPDVLAHAAGGLVPNDPGRGGAPGDWQQLQWNFAGP